MDKIVIVYGTRKGTTAETVRIIASVLVNEFHFQVDLCDSHEVRRLKKRMEEYSVVIIGSSIISGRWKSSVLSFARKKLFDQKKVAVFVTAGGTMNKVNKYGYTKEQATNEAIQKYIDKYQEKFRFSPISKAAFGGKVIRRGEVRYDSRNLADISEWARELGKILQD